MNDRQPREHVVPCRRCTGTTWNLDCVCDTCLAAGKLPTYTPTFPVVDGVETVTGRLACCGAGPDQRDLRTTERLHLPGCSVLALEQITAARRLLGRPA